jgi:hypothetical protein
MSEFGYQVRAIEERVWVVGYAKPIVGRTTAWTRHPSRCLSRDAIYEVEGSVGCSDEAAITASAAQDTLRAAWQLSGEPDIDLLAERTPRVSRIEPVNVPVLEAVGPLAEEQLGVSTDENTTPLEEDCRPFRRAVSALRADGWKGAILLPGPTHQVRSVIIPRSFVHAGRLMIPHTDRLRVPRAVVEYALGLNRAFPRSCWTLPAGFLPLRDAS